MATKITPKTGDVKVPVNVSALIRSIEGKRGLFTNARNALIGHLHLIGIPNADIVSETGVDKGDVSRVVSLTKSQSATFQRSLKGLSVNGMSADDVDTLTAAAALGAKLVRKRTNTDSNKSGGAAPMPAPESGTVRVAGEAGKGEDRDILEVTFEWLTADYATRLPLVNAMLANAEAFVATQAAEADAA